MQVNKPYANFEKQNTTNLFLFRAKMFSIHPLLFYWFLQYIRYFVTVAFFLV